MTATSENLTLTTEHASSSYGIPVLIFQGKAYGPADIMPGFEPRNAHDVVYSHTLLRKASLAADWLELQKKFSLKK